MKLKLILGTVVWALSVIGFEGRLIESGLVKLGIPGIVRRGLESL